MDSNTLTSLSRPVTEYVRLDIPQNVQLFIINENLVGTDAGRHVAVSGSFRLAIHQFIVNSEHVHRIQIFCSLPLERSFRILLVDWDPVPRSRAIIGYLLYERMLGVLQVSDYRMSLAQGIIPNIFRDDTVYILGMRFEGYLCPVRITSTITDTNGVSYRDIIIAQRLANLISSVRADRFNSLRPNINRSRFIDSPTRVINASAIEPNSTVSTVSNVPITSTITTASTVPTRVIDNQSIGTQTIQPTILPLSRAIMPNVPVATVQPFRPNVDNRYRNYPNPDGAAARPAGESDSDSFDFEDFL